MLKIILYCSNLKDFQMQKEELLAKGYSADSVFFGNSAINTREELINENSNSWLLFLDHDCLPGPGFKEELQKTIESGSSNCVVAGVYKNPPGASLLQRVHNTIANIWLEQSYEGSGEPALLGGVFLVNARNSVDLPPKKFWGGEDKLLAQNFKKVGYSIELNRGLTVVHNTSRSFLHFLKRAILHGRNDAIYFDSSRNAFKASYWRQKIDFSDWRLTLLILLHFCIQRAAKASQTVLRKNKR